MTGDPGEFVAIYYTFRVFATIQKKGSWVHLAPVALNPDSSGQGDICHLSELPIKLMA